MLSDSVIESVTYWSESVLSHKIADSLISSEKKRKYFFLVQISKCILKFINLIQYLRNLHWLNYLFEKKWRKKQIFTYWVNKFFYILINRNTPILKFWEIYKCIHKFLVTMLLIKFDYNVKFKLIGFFKEIWKSSLL